MIERFYIKTSQNEMPLSIETFNKLFEELFKFLSNKVTYCPPKKYTIEDKILLEQRFDKYSGSLDYFLQEITENDFVIENGFISGLTNIAIQAYDEGILEIYSIFFNYRFIATTKLQKIYEIHLRRFIISIYLYNLVKFLQNPTLETKLIKNIKYTTTTQMNKYLVQYLELEESTDYKMLLQTNGDPLLNNDGEYLYTANFNKSKLSNPEILNRIKLKSQIELQNSFNYAVKILKNQNLDQRKLSNKVNTVNIITYLNNYIDNMIK